MEERSQARGESALFIVILAAILVVVNIVSIRLFARVDLTENRAHSLSKGSLRVTEGLKDRLTVKAYFTKNLPPPFNTTEQYVRDLLEEYQARSKGKMTVEFIDPSTETLAEEARQAGVREVTHQVIEKDQASEKKGFRGIQFLYMGDSKVIDVITDTVGLEYEITSKLKQLSGEKSTIAFLQGHNEPKTMRPPPQDPYSMDQEPPAPLENTRKLLTQYNVRELDLRKGEDSIPEDIKALVVIGPTEKIPEDEIFRIDQFIMRGGSAAFFVDGIAVDTSTGLVSTQENDVGLDAFLEHFGVKLRKDIAFDLQCDTVPIRGPFGLPLATKYPAWPVMEITVDHPAVFRLPVLTFPWASTLVTTPNAKAGKVKTTVLASTTAKSWREEGSIELEPSQSDWKQRYESATMRGPFVMAAAVEGKFKSFFESRPVPAAVKGAGEPEVKKRADKEGRILVAGSSQMTLDPIVAVLARLHRAGDLAANQAFLLNSIDWLTQEQDLIEIRAKGVENPRLNEISDSTRNLVKYGNILAWPLLFVVLGVVRWAIRSRKGRGVRAAAPAEKPRSEKDEREPVEAKKDGDSGGDSDEKEDEAEKEKEEEKKEVEEDKEADKEDRS
jgi:gliding-associated putative ABC transporter substrate-binding component GldG